MFDETTLLALLTLLTADVRACLETPEGRRRVSVRVLVTP